ncbi:NAD-dependent epimerase/dehydratase family protein [Blastopirellula marina]|uniref:NAD-dependent epimerase/dehydratase domain-containing protein n=1 Tax=Blastopirellula marina DSM 3645 TaxID=314230 RepID=A3ZXH3_9BACT|nr:NAD(P)-dependent oxidoreductase [Blastopirellula marina]EAQ78763.1 hypothetical protein DSM3645_29716 [Blastopirellula marina DSM 3645]
MDATKKEERRVVLVTGGAGLIGSRVIHDLASSFQVIGLDIDPPSSDRADVDWRQCDLTDDDNVSDTLQAIRDRWGSQLASVVHLAAYYDFSGEPSPLYEKLTVEGTRSLLRHLQSFDVEQFLFSSTLLVMKSSESGLPLSSQSPLEAEWDYPQSKLKTEEVIEHERGRIPALILRLAGAYDEQGHSPPITQQISRIYEKQLESYFFPGDKDHGQSFIHLDDTVTAIRCAIERRAELPPLERLLIGEEEVLSYADLQDRIGELLHGQQWPAIRIPKMVAKAGAWVKDQWASGDNAPFIKPWMIDLADQNYPINISRAESLLGWKPRHTLRETLPQMVELLQRDPQKFYEINHLPVEHLHSR